MHDGTDHLEPVYLYPDGSETNKVLQEGQKQIVYADQSHSMWCDVTQGEPVLPLKAHGEVWHMGWDIPTQWAIDGSGQVWVSGGRTTLEELLTSCEEDEGWVEVAELAGLKVQKCGVCGRVWKTEQSPGTFCCPGRKALAEMRKEAWTGKLSPSEAWVVLDDGIKKLLGE